MSGAQIVERDAVPYVGVRGVVALDGIECIAHRIGDVAAWVGSRGVAPAGAPFLRYAVIDMPRRLEIEAGVPVAAAVDGEGDVFAGTLPAGRFVTVTHVGAPDGLAAATAGLLAWAADHGLAWDVHDTPEGQSWACRLEVYRTSPAAQPDMSRWETDLVFKLAD
jgi:effector-binding domain-containing protein